MVESSSRCSEWEDRRTFFELALVLAQRQWYQLPVAAGTLLEREGVF